MRTLSMLLVLVVVSGCTNGSGESHPSPSGSAASGRAALNFPEWQGDWHRYSVGTLDILAQYTKSIEPEERSYPEHIRTATQQGVPCNHDTVADRPTSHPFTWCDRQRYFVASPAAWTHRVQQHSSTPVPISEYVVTAWVHYLAAYDHRQAGFDPAGSPVTVLYYCHLGRVVGGLQAGGMLPSMAHRNNTAFMEGFTTGNCRRLYATTVSGGGATHPRWGSSPPTEYSVANKDWHQERVGYI